MTPDVLVHGCYDLETNGKTGLIPRTADDTCSASLFP